MLQIESDRSFLETLEARLSNEIKKDQRDLVREGKNPPWLILALANQMLDLGLVRFVLHGDVEGAREAMALALDYFDQLVELAVAGDRHARTWLVARDAKLTMLVALALGDVERARAAGERLGRLTIHRFKKVEAADLAVLRALLGGADVTPQIGVFDEQLLPYRKGRPPAGQEVPDWRVQDLRGWLLAYQGLADGSGEDVAAGLVDVLEVFRQRAEERIDANIRKFFHLQAVGLLNLAAHSGVEVELEAPEVPAEFRL